MLEQPHTTNTPLITSETVGPIESVYSQENYAAWRNQNLKKSPYGLLVWLRYLTGIAVFAGVYYIADSAFEWNKPILVIASLLAFAGLWLMRRLFFLAFVAIVAFLALLPIIAVLSAIITSIPLGVAIIIAALITAWAIRR